MDYLPKIYVHESRTPPDRCCGVYVVWSDHIQSSRVEVASALGGPAGGFLLYCNSTVPIEVLCWQSPPPPPYFFNSMNICRSE